MTHRCANIIRGFQRRNCPNIRDLLNVVGFEMEFTKRQRIAPHGDKNIVQEMGFKKYHSGRVM
jgi:hypothetical protein